MVSLYKSGARSLRELGEQYHISYVSVLNAVRAYEKHAAEVLGTQVVDEKNEKSTRSDDALSPQNTLIMTNKPDLKTNFDPDFHSLPESSQYNASKSRRALVRALKRSVKKQDKNDNNYSAEDMRTMLRPFSPDMIARALEIALDRHDNRNALSALKMLLEIIVPKAAEPLVIRQDTEALERLTKRLTEASNDDEEQSGAAHPASSTAVNKAVKAARVGKA